MLGLSSTILLEDRRSAILWAPLDDVDVHALIPWFFFAIVAGRQAVKAIWERHRAGRVAAALRVLFVKHRGRARIFSSMPAQASSCTFQPCIVSLILWIRGRYTCGQCMYL